MKITTTEKSLEYAYPSSPLAERYGCAATGCWLVATYTTEGVEVGRRAFDSKDEAKGAFAAVESPVYRFSH